MSRTTSLQTDVGTFVGRSAEFDEIERAFAKMQEGRTLTVSVEGPSGIGKSALVTRFTQQLATSGQGAMVLSGRCYERETTRFKALDGIVDALATALTRLSRAERQGLVPRNAALLKQLFPVLGRVDTILRAPRPALTPRDAVEERRWMFASLRELLGKLAEHRPLVLVIDDMHWADGDSLELLRVLLDESQEPAPRLLLLVTSRAPWLGVAGHGAAEPWPVELRTIALTPLPAGDATSLAQALLERHGKADVDVDAMVRESGGHPLFVAELARHAATLHADNCAQLTLDGAIRERARTLPVPALRVLHFLAVAASPLSAHILELATGLSPTLLERQLGVLRVEGFARSHAGRDRRVEPYHDRVREAVLDQLTSEQRRELHATLAALLEQEPGVDLELVAQHYLDAGDRDKACVLYERAARRAEEGFAFERAALLYRLQLTLRTLSLAEQSDVHRKAGDALARAGLGHAAADAYAMAIPGADNLASVQLRYLSATHLLRSGYTTEGLAAFEQVLTGVGLRTSRSQLGAVASFLWERLRRRLSGYRVTFRDPSSVPPQLLARADALFSVAQGLTWIDGVRAAPLAARAVRAALACGERSRVVKALVGEAAFMAMLGRRHIKTIDRLLGMAREAARQVESAQVHGLIAVAESCVAANMSEFRKQYERASEGLRLLENSGGDVQWERASARAFRMWGQIYLGRARELAQESLEAAADAEARKDRWLTSFVRMTSSMWCTLCSPAGDSAAARTMIDDANRAWKDREPGFMHATWVINSVALDVFEQRGRRALERLEAERINLRRSNALRMEAFRLTLTNYMGTAHLLAYLEQPGDASLQEVLRAARTLRSGPGYYRGLADMLSAQVSLIQRRESEALALARRAREQFAMDQTASHLHAALAFEGKVIGGDEGARLCATASEHFRAEGIARPDNVLSLMAPLAVRNAR